MTTPSCAKVSGRSCLSSPTSRSSVEARDGLEAVEQVPRVKPDVVIMDMVMPRMNGLEATRQIKKRFPDVRILILSMYDDDEYVLQIIQAGASGYVLKRVATEELVNAIREVYKGSSFLYPPIAAKLIDDYVRRVKGADAGEPHEALTVREREVLKLIAEGNTNHEIADILCVRRRPLRATAPTSCASSTCTTSPSS